MSQLEKELKLQKKIARCLYGLLVRQLCSALLWLIAIFLVQVILFNQKIIDEKSKTNETLIHNNSVVMNCKSQVRVLDTNKL